MNDFRHHPDGWIYINDLQLSLAQFLEFEPDYTLPDEYIGREYYQDIEYRLYTQKSETILGTNWIEGDYYISKLEDYRALLEMNNNDLSI